MNEQKLKRLKVLAKEENKEKSSVARELLMDGLKYKMLLGYKEGRISLVKLSKTLPTSLVFLSRLLIAECYSPFYFGGEGGI